MQGHFDSLIKMNSAILLARAPQIVSEANTYMPCIAARHRIKLGKYMACTCQKIRMQLAHVEVVHAPSHLNGACISTRF